MTLIHLSSLPTWYISSSWFTSPTPQGVQPSSLTEPVPPSFPFITSFLVSLGVLLHQVSPPTPEFSSFQLHMNFSSGFYGAQVSLILKGNLLVALYILHQYSTAFLISSKFSKFFPLLFTFKLCCPDSFSQKNKQLFSTYVTYCQLYSFLTFFHQ